MSIKQSQAILKRFIDLKSAFGLRWAQKMKPCFVTLRTFLSFVFPLSSFLFPLSFFLFPLSSFSFPDLSRKDRSESANRVDCRSFSVLAILTGSRPENFLGFEGSVS